MTSGPSELAAPHQRFGRLIERADGADFPFYDGRPRALTASRWIMVVAACALGFVALILPLFPGQAGLLLSRVLFVAIPAAVFAVFARGSARQIFRPLRGVDVLTMIVFWILNAAVSALVAVLVSGGNLSGFTANAATDNLAGSAIVLFYVGTGIQLFGEELFTILPFLAVLSFAHSTSGLPRKTAVVIAWVVTAVWFGAAHLPTYHDNLVQAIVVIGSARLVLTLAYIRTKNIAVSFGAHLINDWVSFTAVLLATALRS